MSTHFFELRNPNTIINIADRVTLGKRIILGQNCIEINLGYGSFLGDDIYIDVPYLTVGEYTSIHKNTTIHGYNPCSIGNNCWIGQNCIIDSIGNVEIRNNVGIGAYSQLWTHSKFGDSLEGCRWNITSELLVKDDVWFSGHCIVSPITAEEKSMLLVGGVITKDMKANHIYGGSPAADITNKLGYQFESIPTEEKRLNFYKLYEDFLKSSDIEEKDYNVLVIDRIKDTEISKENKDRTVFFIEDRLYLPNRSDLEFKFMKYLLYDKAKFNPIID